jgi:uncharacterized protein YndB with AHSA1/START domain
MAATHSHVEQPSDRELVITRVFDAPRELVWLAWTDPSHVVHWWGPHGFTATIRQMDVRPGGVWLFVNHGPDGVDYENKIVYREIVKPERLVYIRGGGEGNRLPPFEVTVTFDEQGTQTRLTMRTLFESGAERDRVVKEYGASEGARQTLERLAQYLAQM